MQSRYYDPAIGRFINADNTAYLGADRAFLSYNLFAYCKNNPVFSYDPSGHFGLAGAIIATGAVIGGLMGAFTAATTGGNILESVIEGCINGAIGSACGILMPNPVAAVLLSATASAVVDAATQLTVQYTETNSIDFTKIDPVRAVKTGVLTGLGTAIPAFGQGAANIVDAFGTALIWAEGSAILACVDVVISNTILSPESSATNTAPNSRSNTMREYQLAIL